MSMQITSQTQLLQHINDGGHLQLDGGQVKTQSGIAHFFQKVGDAFRSLSAGGRATIENRKSALEEAVSNMLRNDPNFNPARDAVDPPVFEKKLVTLGAKIHLAKSMSDIPASARDTMKTLIQAKLDTEGFPGEHTIGEIQNRISELKDEYSGNSKLMDCLKFKGSAEFKDLGRAAKAMRDSIKDTITTQLSDTSRMKPNGLHTAYGGDAARKCMSTINGREPMNGQIPSFSDSDTIATLEQEFIDAVPDEHKSYLPLLSMLSSQAGVVGAITMTQETKTGVCLPHFKGIMDLVPNGLNSQWYGHKTSLDIVGNKAILNCTSFHALQVPGGGKLGLAKDVNLGVNRYNLQVEVDMSKPWQPGEMPDITVTNVSVHPSSDN